MANLFASSANPMHFAKKDSSMQANSSEIHAGQMEGKASCRLALGPKRPSEELRKRHEEKKKKTNIYICTHIHMLESSNPWFNEEIKLRDLLSSQTKLHSLNLLAKIMAAHSKNVPVRFHGAPQDPLK